MVISGGAFMSPSKLKQILLFILGLAIMVGLLFIFFYVFLFLAIIGIIYYIYKKLFKKSKKVHEVKEESKKINPVIIDMED